MRGSEKAVNELVLFRYGDRRIGKEVAVDPEPIQNYPWWRGKLNRWWYRTNQSLRV